jgi:hypothetical protein
MRFFKSAATRTFFSVFAVAILLLSVSAEARKKGFQETPPPEISARVTGVKPVAPQPQPDQVESGLSVTYVFGKWRHLDDMPDPDDPPDKKDDPHRPGPPILKLDHEFGGGKVYDSGRICCVGAHISGMIRFTKAGDYRFRALSNDGARVLVGGQVVVEDPAQHRDRLSVPVTATIDNPGWYPLEVKYFQRKGTASFSLQWRPPGASEFQPIPADAFGRLKK